MVLSPLLLRATPCQEGLQERTHPKPEDLCSLTSPWTAHDVLITTYLIDELPTSRPLDASSPSAHAVDWE